LLAALTLPVASPGSQPPQRGGQRGRERTLEEAMRVPQDEQRQLFGATVSRVRVDVIVTDGDGNFVGDLSAEDFAVSEDGVPQEILDVQLVDLAAGEVHPLLGDNRPVEVRSGGEAVSPRGPEAASSTGAEEGASGSTEASAPETTAASDGGTPAPSAASELGAVIFLVDGPSLSPQTRARFGDAWIDLLEQTDGLSVPRAAYMVDNVGRVQELAPLGYDVDAMRSAADTVREAPFIGNSMNRKMIEIVDDLTNPAFDGAGVDLTQLAKAKVRTFEAEERNRALATYGLLTNFSDALWTRSGRTAVVWVSTGIKLMQGGPYTALFAQESSATTEGLAGARFDIVSPDPRIKNAQEALHRAANGSNVSFYSVDPSLLVESRGIAASAEFSSAAAAALLSTPAIQQSFDGLRDALRTAAAETGGQSFIHATDLGMVLREIEADTSRFYLVTYEPPAPDGDGNYHEIRVDVLRDDTNVRARGGYVDHAPDERAKRLIAAALALPGSVTDLPVETEVFISRPGPGAPNVLLAVAVDGSEVGVMLTQEGERRVSLDIHAIAIKGDEPVAESHEQLYARSPDDGVFRADDDSRLTPTLVGYMAYQREWTLAPGTYTLNVAVLDNVSGRVGAASVDVEVPAADAATWGISDPLLVTVDAAGRVQPVVRGRIVPGQNLAAFVEVYGGQQPILSGQVFLATSDGDGEQQGAKLFPMPLRRIAANIHRGSAPLPPGMPPGRYFVQLVITDPPAEKHKVVRLPIEVVALPGR
jgi:VWFA-related protein